LNITSPVNMDSRHFIKNTAAFAAASALPLSMMAFSKNNRLRTAHIGVGGMGAADLASISSHGKVDVVALCDVDSNALAAAKNCIPVLPSTLITGCYWMR